MVTVLVTTNFISSNNNVNAASVPVASFKGYGTMSISSLQRIGTFLSTSGTAIDLTFLDRGLDSLWAAIQAAASAAGSMGTIATAGSMALLATTLFMCFSLETVSGEEELITILNGYIADMETNPQAFAEFIVGINSQLHTFSAKERGYINEVYKYYNTVAEDKLLYNMGEYISTSFLTEGLLNLALGYHIYLSGGTIMDLSNIYGGTKGKELYEFYSFYKTKIRISASGQISVWDNYANYFRACRNNEFQHYMSLENAVYTMILQRDLISYSDTLSNIKIDEFVKNGLPTNIKMAELVPISTKADGTIDSKDLISYLEYLFNGNTVFLEPDELTKQWFWDNNIWKSNLTNNQLLPIFGDYSNYMVKNNVKDTYMNAYTWVVTDGNYICSMSVNKGYIDSFKSQFSYADNIEVNFIYESNFVQLHDIQMYAYKNGVKIATQYIYDWNDSPRYGYYLTQANFIRVGTYDMNLLTLSSGLRVVSNVFGTLYTYGGRYDKFRFLAIPNINTTLSRGTYVDENIGGRSRFYKANELPKELGDITTPRKQVYQDNNITNITVDDLGGIIYDTTPIDKTVLDGGGVTTDDTKIDLTNLSDADIEKLGQLLGLNTKGMDIDQIREIVEGLSDTLGLTLEQIRESINVKDVTLEDIIWGNGDDEDSSSSPSPLNAMVLIWLEIAKILIACLTFVFSLMVVPPTVVLLNENILAGLTFLKTIQLPIFGMSLYTLMMSTVTFVLVLSIVHRINKFIKTRYSKGG
jgi:hypothetical protein